MEDSSWRILASSSSLKEEESPGCQSRNEAFLKYKTAFLKFHKAGVAGVGLCPVGKILLLGVVCVATGPTFADASELDDLVSELSQR